MDGRRKSTFQTFRQEARFTDRSVLMTPHRVPELQENRQGPSVICPGHHHLPPEVCPSPNTVLKEPICCECQARFGGRLPVPRATAELPYWVPLSLRPRKQIPKRVRFFIPQATKTCTCGGHHFGGHLPMPRGQAAMPYWVPRGLRSPKKVVIRQRNYPDMQEAPVDLRSWHNRWQICGDRHLLLKWQRLQVPQQDRLLALGTLLPLSLGLLALLQAVLRAMVAIRQFFWI